MNLSPQESSVRPIDRKLFDACSALDEAAVRAALEAGADSNALNEGTSPFLATLHGEQFEHTFREWMGLPPLSDDDDDDDEDDPPIDESKANAFDQEADRRRIRCFDVLLAHNANINQDLGEDELLWHAVHHSPAIVEYLLSHGADPNLRASGNNDKDNPFTTPPLDHAWTDEIVYRDDDSVTKDFAEIATLLLAFGARPLWDDAIRESDIDPEDMNNPHAALVSACQWLDFRAVQIAVHFGAELTTRHQGRSLPVVALQDSPPLRGPYLSAHGWSLEAELRDFLFFLLVGLGVPISRTDAVKILRATVDNGYEVLRSALVGHHSLGSLFREAAAALDPDTALSPSPTNEPRILDP